MTAEQRRQAIARRLEGAEGPVPAAALAGELGVSRQIVVGDVALLRASGAQIYATPRGYVSGARQRGTAAAVLACCHAAQDMGRELYAIVDNGGEVVDVIVEHPVYGQLTGQLNLRSRYDVDEFLKKAQGASPLSELTGGIHLHTIRCPDGAALARVTAVLDREGFLLHE